MVSMLFELVHTTVHGAMASSSTDLSLAWLDLQFI